MFKIISVIVIGAFLLVACGESSPRPIPKFKRGDIVVSSMNKEITGQILITTCSNTHKSCTYLVRFDVKMERVRVSEFEIQFKE